MPLDPAAFGNRFVALPAGATPAMEEMGGPTPQGLERLMEMPSPDGALAGGPSPVSGSLTGTGRTALGAIATLTGLAVPGLAGVPGLGLVGKGGEMAGIPGSKGAMQGLAGLLAANPAAAMLGAANIADAAGVTTPNMTTVTQAAAYNNSLNSLGMPGSIAFGNPNGTFTALSDAAVAPALAHGNLQAEPMFANMPTAIRSDQTLSTTPPGLAGLTATANDANMTAGQALGLGAGSMGFANLSLSDLGNLAQSLNISPTAQNLANLAQVQTVSQLRGIIDDAPPGLGAPGLSDSEAAAASAAAAAADADAGGAPGSGVGGVGAGGTGSSSDADAYRHGGTVRDRSRKPGGAEPITAHEDEEVINAPAARRFRPLLKQINRTGLARLMR